MAHPASFEEANTVLGKPPSLTDDQCEALQVLQAKNTEGIPVVVSCWKLTQDEIDEISRTKRVWVVILGDTMPPISVCGEKPF